MDQTLTVSAVFEHSVPLTDSTNSSGTRRSVTSLSTEFLLNPAARALLALALYIVFTSTLTT